MNTRIPYTISHIDPFGTVVFSFSINGIDYTFGENFGVIIDQIDVNENVITAADQLDKLIQDFIQQYLPAQISSSIQSLIGKQQQ